MKNKILKVILILTISLSLVLSTTGLICQADGIPTIYRLSKVYNTYGSGWGVVGSSAYTYGVVAGNSSQQQFTFTFPNQCSGIRLYFEYINYQNLVNVRDIQCDFSFTSNYKRPTSISFGYFCYDDSNRTHPVDLMTQTYDSAYINHMILFDNQTAQFSADKGYIPYFENGALCNVDGFYIQIMGTIPSNFSMSSTVTSPLINDNEFYGNWLFNYTYWQSNAEPPELARDVEGIGNYLDNSVISDTTNKNIIKSMYSGFPSLFNNIISSFSSQNPFLQGSRPTSVNAIYWLVVSCGVTLLMVAIFVNWFKRSKKGD